MRIAMRTIRSSVSTRFRHRVDTRVVGRRVSKRWSWNCVSYGVIPNGVCGVRDLAVTGFQPVVPMRVISGPFPNARHPEASPKDLHGAMGSPPKLVILTQRGKDLRGAMGFLPKLVILRHRRRTCAQRWISFFLSS